MGTFVGRLIFHVIGAFVAALLIGSLADSPELAVGVFLLFAVLFKRAVFEPIDRA